MKPVLVGVCTVTLALVGCGQSSPPAAVVAQPETGTTAVSSIAASDISPTTVPSNPTRVTDVVHAFLKPYFADCDSIVFANEKETMDENTGRTTVSGTVEATLPAVWFLIENDYEVTCDKDDNGRWEVEYLSFDGQLVFVAPSQARIHANFRNVTKTPRPLRAKPGAKAPTATVSDEAEKAAKADGGDQRQLVLAARSLLKLYCDEVPGLEILSHFDTEIHETVGSDKQPMVVGNVKVRLGQDTNTVPYAVVLYLDKGQYVAAFVMIHDNILFATPEMRAALAPKR